MVTAARFLAIAACVVGCSQGAAPAVESAALSQVQGVVIAQIVTHDAKVALLGGGPELRVVVRKLDGTMVADGVTLAALRTREPELYEVVTSAFASSDHYVDATLDLGHLN